jgi:predicted dehydrogenase
MRRTCIVGSNRMITYDDTEPSEKVKIYDRGVSLRTPETFGEFQLTYRMGDVLSPYLANTEPLLLEIDHFIESIEQKHMPRTDGYFGANVVRAIEMAISSAWEPGDVSSSQQELVLHQEAT